MQKSQPEVSAVIDWVYNNPDNPFVLSANLLDGAMVATYPFDDGTTQIKVYKAYECLQYYSEHLLTVPYS